MSDEFTPTPEPSGALVPPPTHPPTAVAAATPEPPLPSRSATTTDAPWLLQTIRRAVNAALDVADDLARIVTTTFESPRDRRP